MRPADDFHDLGDGLFAWSAFSPAAKVELHAHALALPEVGTNGERGIVFVDPIALRPAALEELLAAAGGASVTAVLLTNGNHARAAADFRRRFHVPVFASTDARAALREDGLEIDEEVPAASRAGENSSAGGTAQLFAENAWRAIPLPGFAPGETAFFAPGVGGGTLLVGDALINLAPPYDFVPLPKKYCTAPKTATSSLRRLLELPFARMTFAHGDPLLSKAHERLAALVNATP